MWHSQGDKDEDNVTIIITISIITPSNNNNYNDDYFNNENKILLIFLTLFLPLLSTFRTQRKESLINLFGTTIDIDLNNVADLKLKNQANTNILRWGDRLLAFFEAGVPHRWGI